MNPEVILITLFGTILTILAWIGIREIGKLEATTKSFFEQAITMARYDERLKQLEIRRDYIDEWKHLTVDIYLPRAMDDHERRLTKLENHR
jgi:hypothetical protein